MSPGTFQHIDTFLLSSEDSDKDDDEDDNSGGLLEAWNIEAKGFLDG